MHEPAPPSLKSRTYLEMRVRIYIPEYSLQWVRLDSRRLGETGRAIWSHPGALGLARTCINDPEPGVIEILDYEGIRSPHYYLATVIILNKDRELREGMAATAKIYSDRHSIAALAWRASREFLARRIW